MKKMPIRLALRHEGEFWNAYMAQQGTMEGAKLIGSIIIGSAMQSSEIKQDFMDLMKKVMNLGIQKLTGEEDPDWGEPTSASEIERGGHG